jgi:hypothetical protein
VLTVPQPSPGDSRKLTLADPIMTGDDVKAAQQVLHDNRFGINFHPGGADRQYGQKTADATRLAKFLLGYPEAEVNGEFGPNLYGYLVRKGTPGYRQRPNTFVGPSAHRRRLFKANSSVRERMVSWCLWSVENTTQIHYAKKRPIPIHDLPGTLPLTTDCSGSTTLFARWAEAPDPNGFGYTGAGSTMTMLAHLKPITADNAQPGDIIVFGGDPLKQHVVVIVEPGEDPTVTSHGSEQAPFKLKLSEVSPDHQGQPIVYLALM